MLFTPINLLISKQKVSRNKKTIYSHRASNSNSIFISFNDYFSSDNNEITAYNKINLRRKSVNENKFIFKSSIFSTNSDSHKKSPSKIIKNVQKNDPFKSKFSHGNISHRDPIRKSLIKINTSLKYNVNMGSKNYIKNYNDELSDCVNLTENKRTIECNHSKHISCIAIKKNKEGINNYKFKGKINYNCKKTGQHRRMLSADEKIMKKFWGVNYNAYTSHSISIKNQKFSDLKKKVMNSKNKIDYSYYKVNNLSHYMEQLKCIFKGNK